MAQEIPPIVVAPDCPRCGRPLRLDRCDGGDRWRCTNGPCGYTSTREHAVELLLKKLRETEVLFERLAQLALPDLVGRLVSDLPRCEACEKLARRALGEALDSADARRSSAEASS